MTIRRFLESAGVQYEEIWPGDRVSRLRARREELVETIKTLQRTLFRIQRKMAALRSRAERHPRSLNREDTRLENMEMKYRRDLQALWRAERKLATLRTRLAISNVRSLR
jgi:hypothetical protein